MPLYVAPSPASFSRSIRECVNRPLTSMLSLSSSLLNALSFSKLMRIKSSSPTAQTSSARLRSSGGGTGIEGSRFVPRGVEGRDREEAEKGRGEDVAGAEEA